MTSPIELSSLTDEEQMALAGMIRLAIHIDGDVSLEERIVLALVANRFSDSDALHALVDRAETDVPDEASAKALAQKVERPETRELIREIVREIVDQGELESEEQELLDWLGTAWD